MDFALIVIFYRRCNNSKKNFKKNMKNNFIKSFLAILILLVLTKNINADELKSYDSHEFNFFSGVFDMTNEAKNSEQAAKELVTDAPYMKPALQQREGTSYKSFMADVQSAKDRLKKKIEDRKKKAVSYRDIVAGNMEKEKKRKQKEMDQEAERKQAIRAREALKQELKRELVSEKN